MDFLSRVLRRFGLAVRIALMFAALPVTAAR
jgi:hypothetical protein